MLTRFVRIQLAIFTAASLIAMTVIAARYLDFPELLGIGRINVTVELPSTGGLYRFSNVSYRGVQVGRVTDVEPTDAGATATLSLAASTPIPANVTADVHSVSAVGEQFLELTPRTDSGSYLHDGSIIHRADTSVPQQVGPLLDQLGALTQSIPETSLGRLIDASGRAFGGAGYDLGSLLDSASVISSDADKTASRTATLVTDAQPFIDAQARSADSLRSWAHHLSAVTGQIVNDDSQIRSLLHRGPGFANEVEQLLAHIKPTLPILLANLTTIGQIALTYHPALEQLLVLLPPYVGAYSSFAPTNNPSGHALGGFAFSISDPPVCTVGFLPPSQWRSPEDTSEVDTPDNLYCKLPQDSPISVRGARNYPCIGKPGKRAPTVQICDSDQPYEPLAMRQHALGPYPLDPNLISQGIAPDSRANSDARIYGPLEGTPQPAQAPEPSPPEATAPPQSSNQPEPQPTPRPPDTTTLAPSAYHEGAHGPSVAVVRYDPKSGRYIDPQGNALTQTNLAAPASNWTDLLLPVPKDPQRQ
ncbi:MlaD family protein [Mycobacterium sp. OTB74]|uniref:MlaD family protein n=1 Tax=Mycobacterium sp. OTB74 TaxID=1853452 RepID=UPI0024731746|nr:MlaD family protein [Mycobacterium sp. OTB74]MDH6246473.1 phospholipid/cholesterol/gamma-HCH transport system substrate-binding protein [Mycobacterium sp. OTB74]